MPAGREMDVLIAEKVMGWRRHNAHGDWWETSDGRCFVVKNSGFSAQYDPMPELPAFSTDVADAWNVIEEMKSTWGKFMLSYGPYLVGVENKLKDGWQLAPEWGNSVCGYGETAPLAICRAAIKARM